MDIIKGLKKLIAKVYGKVPKDPSNVSDVVDYINDKFGTKDTQQYFDLLNAVINKSPKAKKELLIDDSGSINDVIKTLLKDENLEPLILDLFDRRNRYSSYRTVVKKISRLKRALKILTSNIIVGDNLMTSDDFIIRTNKLIEIDDKKEVEIKEQIKLIITFFKLKDFRKKIIHDTLQFGDYFIEIIDTKKVIDDILLESHTIKDSLKNKKITIDNIEVNVKLKKYGDTKKILLESEAVKNNIDSFFDTLENILTEKNNNLNNTEENTTLENLKLQLHHPENVIKLSIGDERIGYLIVPKYMFMKSANTFAMGFRTATWPGMNPAQTHGQEVQFSLYQTATRLAEKVIKFLEKETIKGIIQENPELKYTIIKFIYAAIQENIDLSKSDHLKKLVINDLNFRFVPYEYMQEFSIDVDEYDPYGTSILDQLLFDSKLLLTNKLSATILRLTRSIERRIIEFEVNDRDSKAAAEVLKEKFKKARFMFNDQAGVDTIPTLLTPYQDLFLPIKNGQRFVNVSYGDASNSLPTVNDDIRFLRDELVSYFDIPPAYLGLEENIESKATLYLQNMIFAVTVMDYKTIFAKQFTELIDKVLKLTGKQELIGKYELIFNIPVILNSSSEIEHLNQMTGVWDFIVNQLKIPYEKALERYLPQFLEMIDEESKVENKLKQMKNKTAGKQQGNEEGELGGEEEGFGEEGGGESLSAEDMFQI